MKKIFAVIMMCFSSVVIVSFSPAADFIISSPFAFKERFPEGAEKLGLPEGDVLQVGCFIKPVGTPIKEITIKNLASGLVLKAVPMKYADLYPGLYEVHPYPPFDPIKHMGVWEVSVKDPTGSVITETTPEMDLKGQMPYIEGVKATGDPLSPTIAWKPVNPADVPTGAEIRYRVTLLKDGDNQFYMSRPSPLTAHAVPGGKFKSEDLSKIYVRINCMGFDKKDKKNSYPLEFQSSTILPLKDILDDQ